MFRIILATVIWYVPVLCITRGTHWSQGCPNGISPVIDDPTMYIQKIYNRPHKRRCAPGTRFDPSKCMCSILIDTLPLEGTGSPFGEYYTTAMPTTTLYSSETSKLKTKDFIGSVFGLSPGFPMQAQQSKGFDIKRQDFFKTSITSIVDRQEISKSNSNIVKQLNEMTSVPTAKPAIYDFNRQDVTTESIPLSIDSIITQSDPFKKVLGIQPQASSGLGPPNPGSSQKNVDAVLPQERKTSKLNSTTRISRENITSDITTLINTTNTKIPGKIISVGQWGLGLRKMTKLNNKLFTSKNVRNQENIKPSFKKPTEKTLKNIRHQEKVKMIIRKPSNNTLKNIRNTNKVKLSSKKLDVHRTAIKFHSITRKNTTISKQNTTKVGNKNANKSINNLNQLSELIQNMDHQGLPKKIVSLLKGVAQITSKLNKKLVTATKDKKKHPTPNKGPTTPIPKTTSPKIKVKSKISIDVVNKAKQSGVLKSLPFRSLGVAKVKNATTTDHHLWNLQMSGSDSKTKSESRVNSNLSANNKQQATGTGFKDGVFNIYTTTSTELPVPTNGYQIRSWLPTRGFETATQMTKNRLSAGSGKQNSLPTSMLNMGLQNTQVFNQRNVQNPSIFADTQMAKQQLSANGGLENPLPTFMLSAGAESYVQNKQQLLNTRNVQNPNFFRSNPVGPTNQIPSSKSTFDKQKPARVSMNINGDTFSNSAKIFPANAQSPSKSMQTKQAAGMNKAKGMIPNVNKFPNFLQDINTLTSGVSGVSTAQKTDRSLNQQILNNHQTARASQNMNLPPTLKQVKELTPGVKQQLNNWLSQYNNQGRRPATAGSDKTSPLLFGKLKQPLVKNPEPTSNIANSAVKQQDMKQLSILMFGGMDQVMQTPQPNPQMNQPSFDIQLFKNMMGSNPFRSLSNNQQKINSQLFQTAFSNPFRNTGGGETAELSDVIERSIEGNSEASEKTSGQASTASPSIFNQHAFMYNMQQAQQNAMNQLLGGNPRSTAFLNTGLQDLLIGNKNTKKITNQPPSSRLLNAHTRSNPFKAMQEKLFGSISQQRPNNRPLQATDSSARKKTTAPLDWMNSLFAKSQQKNTQQTGMIPTSPAKNLQMNKIQKPNDNLHNIHRNGKKGRQHLALMKDFSFPAGTGQNAELSRMLQNSGDMSLNPFQQLKTVQNLFNGR